MSKQVIKHGIKKTLGHYIPRLIKQSKPKTAMVAPIVTMVEEKPKEEVKKEVEVVVNDKKIENNDEKIEKVMDTSEKIAIANEVLNDMPQMKARKLKKDKGLFERTESSSIILTEDNRELLKG